MRLEVDGRSCVAYPRLTGPVALGDEVVVNVQAVELELGTGGFDVLHVNLTRGLDLRAEPEAHVMKLPYTSLQHAVLHAEEAGIERESLGGLPVVCCSLHSQVAPVCAGIGEGRRVAYVQLPGGALPVSFSDTVRALRARGLVERSVAVGACFDGDIACVSTAAALLWAAQEGFDAVVCAIGPGIAGTASASGTAGWRPRRRSGRPARSAVGQFSRCATRRATSGSATAASRTTRARSWTLAGTAELGWPSKLERRKSSPT